MQKYQRSRNLRRGAVLGADETRNAVGALVDFSQWHVLKESQSDRRGEGVSGSDGVGDDRRDARMSGDCSADSVDGAAVRATGEGDQPERVSVHQLVNGFIFS